MSTSKTYALAVIGLLTAVLPLIGFEIVDSSSLEEIVTAVIFLGIAADRFLKGDISILGMKQK
jgi:hypothetical protein